MIFVIPKGSDGSLSSHLRVDEFDCKCDRKICAHTLYSPLLLQLFERLRTSLGHRSLAIRSGFRCQAHNKDEEGVIDSKHTLGMAIDIERPNSIPMVEFVYRAEQVGFDVVIPYPTMNFIHCHLTPKIRI